MITITSLRNKLLQAHKRLHNGGWREVGRLHGISGAMAYRIANSDYEPRDPHTRAALGLPAYAPAPVCPRCGVVHVTRRCTRKPAPTRWADYPLDALREALEKRVEMPPV